MTTGYDVTFTSDAAAFLGQAREWLARDPVISTVLSTVAERELAAQEQGEPLPERPFWFATVTDHQGAVVGAAIRTAPFAPYPAFVTAMPEGAALALARDVLARGELVSAVNGALPAAQTLTEELGHGWGVVVVAKHTRLFELGDLVEPTPVVGRLRPATDDEAGLALEWYEAFLSDADEQAGRESAPGEGEHWDLTEMRRRVTEERVWFWVDEDDVPVHVTGANPPALGVARIGPVYTPRECRGRGYASAAVATVSRGLRDAGARVCLFTDQANPTSNGIYVALGFRPVVDMVELVIRPES